MWQLVGHALFVSLLESFSQSMNVNIRLLGDLSQIRRREFGYGRFFGLKAMS